MTPTPHASHRSIALPISPEEAWELVVDDDARNDWFGGDSVLEPRVGGRGRFADDDGTVREALVDDLDPGRRISWTWGTGDDEGHGSRVEIEIVPDDDGSHFSVTETPLTPSASASVLTAPTGRLLDLEMIALTRVHRSAARRTLVAVG